MCVNVLIVIVVTTLVPDEWLLKWGFTMAVDEMEVDEDLPNFFCALLLSEADKIILENK